MNWVVFYVGLVIGVGCGLGIAAMLQAAKRNEED